MLAVGLEVVVCVRFAASNSSPDADTELISNLDLGLESYANPLNAVV
jgi:hypothetical protein